MVEQTQPKRVPGAPLSQSTLAGGKKKSKQSNENRSGSQDAISKAATQASLLEKVPSHEKMDESVKVQARDLAEEAERNGAIAAVAIVKEKENGGHTGEKENKSVLQVILTKRIKVLSKKLQRAVTYEALEEEKLNADMKRIIASKPALESAVAELSEMAKAIEIAETEASKQIEKQSKLAAEVTRRDLQRDSDFKTSILFQFLHLRSLFQPPSPPSFAPPPRPAVVRDATARDAAAIEKLFADLSSSSEVVTQDGKTTLLSKLSSGSDDQLIEGCTFARILELIRGLSSQVVEEPSNASNASLTGAGVSTPAAPTSSRILFMQESEIQNEAEATAVDQVTQAEPEGGSVEGVPSAVIRGGQTEKGLAGSKGSIMGDESVSKGSREDGTARAEVVEPVQTTEVSESAAKAGVAKSAKKIDWAADDDDWSDMMMQPSPLSAAPEGSILPAKTRPLASEAPRLNGSFKQSAEPKGQREQPAPSRKTVPTPEQAPTSAKSSGPAVDEDGFTIASSKRTKMLQQQQQQQQHSAHRNGGKGKRGDFGGHTGRGGARGSGGRGQGSGAGAGAGRSGSGGADNGGRGERL